MARLRRVLGTRRVGHAGTLDPMATGVLVVGVGRATRLLGHLALTEKEYDAVARLGVTTVSDDADGEVTAVSRSRAAGPGGAWPRPSRRLTGALRQRPAASAP